METAKLFARDINRMLGGGPLPSWHGASIKWLVAAGGVMLLCWAVLMYYVVP